jgi:hypothetical protein
MEPVIPHLHLEASPGAEEAAPEPALTGASGHPAEPPAGQSRPGPGQMQTVFSLVFSAMVISDEHTYGPIGTIFALLSYLIAIGVVVILGAVAGRAWHERSPGTSETGRLPPARPFSVATACACPGGDDAICRSSIQGRSAVPSTKTHGAPAAAR